MKKEKVLMLLLMVVTLCLAGCGKDDAYKSLDTGVSGEIAVMVWSGDGEYYEDIGHQNLSAENITARNVAIVYAVAKAFNADYPNVKINLWSKAGSPNDNDTSWSQEIENFRAQYGKYPDIWASNNLVGDVQAGRAADLSVFSEDPVYQSFNKSIMQMMNYYGVQAGLPMLIQPWGVWVNKDLAEQNNIDVPDVDWSIQDYTLFTAQGNKSSFWGAVDIPMDFIETGTKDIAYSLYHYDGSADYINLDSDAVKDLLSMVPMWSDNTIWIQNELGNIPLEIMENGLWWSYGFFSRGYTLTNNGDPWMMSDAANPRGGDNACNFAFDIYPRPSTEYTENTVGIVLDPMALYNYAMDDGDPALSEEEQEKLKLAYTFASYWVGDTVAVKACAEQSWSNGGVASPALGDSLPLVTGEEFDKQMEIWYSIPTHELYGDSQRMPGWAYCMELWEKGQMWNLCKTVYPYYVQEDGVSRAAMNEWENYYQEAYVAASRASAGWVDEIKSKLPEWNKLSNRRFARAAEEMKNALKEFYGYKEDK